MVNSFLILGSEIKYKFFANPTPPPLKKTVLFPRDNTLHHHLPSTIITIAHRLNTVLDYDRILVLKEGAIAELDTPRFLTNIGHGLSSRFFRNLLKVEGGIFKGMCQDAGVSLNS